ncbi:extensin family protein [Hyphomicrobium sp. D-2]|uniref:extensin-like domain-containing protein n=1 Tax=Hyphomicrobium sp. D-2 TaxID=3041621 RepID=UPI0024549D45|nr:extensin family protein [Hyphomicrobium sp. D-2]MDH4983042.1 extensin family protein [Hyphomicrobium sp. D-2]MDH4983242.1 extensin family protein [Hyphomicrobium sp. D-2]
MRRTGRNILRAILLLLLILAGAAVFRFGLIPERFLPFPAITLDDPPLIFVDTRIAALRSDPDMCRAILQPPQINAQAIADNVRANGCGWTDAVRVSKVSGAEIGLSALTCETAVALALWMEHSVQPLAMEMFGSRVVWVQDMGTYNCRNIIGNKRWLKMRSQHSYANAVDIGAFRLENGKQMSITRDYRANTPEGRFLREAHMRACPYFRVAIGPEFNEAHHDHLHLDRGLLRSCK